MEKQYNFFMHKLVAFVMLMVAGVVFSGALFLVGAVRLTEASWFGPAMMWFPQLQGLGGWMAVFADARCDS